MDLKTRSADAALRVKSQTSVEPQAAEFLRPSRVDVDKLAAKLERRPSGQVAEKLLLVAAKIEKRRGRAEANRHTPPSISTES